MRSRVRDRQKVWFVTVTEKKVGIDTVQEYGKPIMKKMAVAEDKTDGNIRKRGKLYNVRRAQKEECDTICLNLITSNK